MAKSKRQGGITQRSKGSWEIRFNVLTDGNGKRKRVTETIKGTRKEAEKRLREKLGEIDNNRHVGKSKETVSQFMTRWMDTHVAMNCTLRTAQGYHGYIQRYIDPTIGSLILQKLTSIQIDAIYAEMVASGLSNTTVVQLHRILRKALSWGITKKVLTSNPVDGATPPKKRQHRMEMWDVPTITKFLGLSKGTRFGDLYNFAVLTGLRRSEISGLKWESVDLTVGSLSVVAVLHRIKGHGLVEVEPKTTGSRRSLDLASETIDLLHSIRGRQNLERLEYGPVWKDTGYVFTHPDGSPLIPDQITQDFARVIKKYGLPHLTFHGLRHAHATLSLKAGINPKIVSEALGHSKVGITLDLYSHVLPNMQKEAAQVVANLLKGEP
jgi:integrase